jgi:hypothetical protein
MTTRNTNLPFFSSFLNKILMVISVSGIIGFALGFTKYFNNTYYFPLIPNIFDSIFLIFASVYLGINIIILNRKGDYK